jgi:hypothetical protein
VSAYAHPDALKRAHPGAVACVAIVGKAVSGSVCFGQGQAGQRQAGRVFSFLILLRFPSVSQDSQHARQDHMCGPARALRLLAVFGGVVGYIRCLILCGGVCVTFGQNFPLFLKAFSDDDVLKLQLAVYSSLDVIEERSRSDLSLGLLCPVDELKV